MSERTITPLRGGDLITDYSADAVGPDNYVARENMRFDQGAEVMVHGHDWFREKLGLSEDITLIHDVNRQNGDRCTIIGTPTTLYRYHEKLDAWWKIGEGFDPDAQRWEAVNYEGYVFFNNGSDLPCYYRVEFSTTPKYIAFGDGRVIGTENVPIAFPGEATPVIPLYELREQGIAYARTMEVFNNVLTFGNVTELITDYLSVWMNGDNPYGRIQDTHPEYLTTTPYRIINSDYDPTRWKLGVLARVYAANPDVIETEIPLRSIKILDEVNFRETEEDGEDVEVFITQAIVRSISEDNKHFTIDRADDETPITTDSVGFLTRYTWAQEVAGYIDVQSDGSGINVLRKVGNRLVALRETGFSTLYSSNGLLLPDTDPYIGEHRAIYRNLITVMNDESLLFRARDAWYEVDLVRKKPKEPVKLNMIRDAVDWSAYDSRQIFIGRNATESEIWICYPGGTIAFDYKDDRVYTMDAAFTALGVVWQGGKEILLMASDGNVLVQTPGEYTRCGETFEGRLKFGLFGREGRETIFDNIIPHLSTKSGDYDVIYRLFQLASTVSSPVLVGEVAVSPISAHIQPTARSPYFQEELVFKSPAKYGGRFIEYRQIATRLSRHAS